MQNQLPYGTPDYLGLLYLTNAKTMPIAGSKISIVHEFEDGRIRVLNTSGSNFDIEIQFTNISDSNRGLINTLFHDSTKANGGENTFLWKHPLEDMSYVARFLSPLRNVYKPGEVNSVDVIKLRISAYYQILISPYLEDMSDYFEADYMDFI